MSNFEVTLSNQQIFNVEKGLIDLKIDNMLKSIMTDSLLKINVLVNSGRNVFGDPFIPYSASYSLWRSKTGRSTRPNMQNTSSMMNSLGITRRGKYTYIIGAKGTDRFGNSNVAKLKKLESYKNYKILFWSKILQDIADRYLNNLKF